MFDIQTMLLILVMVGFAQSATLFYVWMVNRSYKPAAYWAAGAMMCALGVLPIAFRGYLPLWISVVVANLAIVPGWMIRDYGIIRAAGRKLPLRAGIAVAAVTVFLLYWFSLVDQSYKTRSLIFGITIALFDGYAAWSCVRARGGRRRRATLAIIGVLLAADAGSALWRGVGAHVLDLHSIFEPTLTQTQFFLFHIFHLFTLTVLLVLMTAQMLQDDLDEASQRDFLTNAYNRRALKGLANREWAAMRRHDHDLTFLVLDIDHFKRFNDRHGHAVGDAALKAVSQAAETVLRTEDIWCRYGGEEFLAVLPQTTAANGRVIAERIREAMSDVRIAEGAVTVSVGVAQARPEDKSWQDTVHAADLALYRAKAQGRNCVVVSEAPL